MNGLRNSLATRIFVAIAATAVLIVAIMALLVALSMRDGFARYLLRGELARFSDLEQALAMANDPDAPGWPELTANPKSWNDFVRMHFTPPGAEGFARPWPPPGPPPGRPGGPPPVPPPAGDDLMIGDRLELLGPDGERLAGSTERSGLFERREICVDGNCSGAGLLGYIGLSAPLFSENASNRFFLQRQYVSLALSALIAILVSAVAAWLVARQILIPIRQLEQGAKTMASGDYTVRMTQDRTDELGQLIGHYNVLAATLERTDKAEREWISNISHELQTPLATLRAQIEALQDGIRKPDAGTLSGMHAAMMRLSRLVQDIKTLSYAREGGLLTTFRREDLSSIARDRAKAARPQFAAKGIALDVDAPETADLECDRVQIGQVLDNLLQNAARYTDAPGRVSLRVEDGDGFVRVIMDDSPPPPSADDLPRLFDRFYRAESSRSRAFGGSGLGLSVCMAIVEGHGGAITASPSDLGGLRITIRIPKRAT